MTFDMKQKVIYKQIEAKNHCYRMLIYLIKHRLVIKNWISLNNWFVKAFLFQLT
jgi:hypothetical protein